MARLNTYVHVHDKDGEAHVFGPDDEVPGWAVKAITNDAVWAEHPSKSNPQTGSTPVQRGQSN